MTQQQSDNSLAAIDHLDIWSGAWKKKAGTGRGNNGKLTPYGTQKLRELILELAVRGRLVPQDPNDEPASMLLEKIAEEKAGLVKEGKIKKQKKLLEIAENEKPFDLPEGWEWTRLGEITPYGVTDKAEAADVSQDTWVLELEDIEKTTSSLLKRVRFSDRKFKSTKNRFSAGDVLYGKLRPYLDKVLIADEDGVCTTEIIPIKVLGGVDALFLRLLLKSPDFIRYANESTHGMNLPRLGTDKARLALLPVAPLAEQHRIIAKVNELMALCDRLEQKQTDSLQAHQTLVETLLDTLVRPTARDGGSEENAGAIFFQHFDTLFTTEHSIDQLKQTLLQLAVMGKLVPQDPNDEPASVLLERIVKEKERSVEKGKIRKQKALPEITNDEKIFNLPVGWEWVKFGMLAEFINGDRSKNYPNRNEYVEEGVPWINTGHIEPSGFLATTGMNYITREKFNSLRSGKIQSGDLVYCLRGATFGKTAYVEPYEEGAIASSLMIIRPYIRSLNDYIFKYLVSPFGKSQLLRFDNGSAQPNLSANSVMLYAFPLPPLAEQHRIVAKVDELMTLCDALKARIQQAETTQLQLADAVVAQAVGQ